jgi:hypothetical protein
MGPDQRRLERQSSMPSERPKSNYGNYHMRYFKISAYGATPWDTSSTLPKGLKVRPIEPILPKPTKSGRILSRLPGILTQLEHS